ncbi:MAG: polysaccharide biosynthesis protein [Candidatus Eutrophobiaceae bacterium]
MKARFPKLSLICSSRVEKILVIAHDLLVAPLAWLFAWFLRTGFERPFGDGHFVFLSALTVTVCHAMSLWRFKPHLGLWRHVGMADLRNILAVTLFGTFFSLFALFMLFRLEAIPRSLIVLYPVFLLLLLSTSRFVYRYWHENSHIIQKLGREQEPVLIIGAGNAAESLLRDILRNGRYLPTALLDDNPELSGKELHGVTVFTGIERTAEIARRYNVERIFVAIPSANGAQMARIVEHCEDTGLPLLTLPGFNETLNRQVSLAALRGISIGDLLGREIVEPNWQLIKASAQGKCVLITGGGGSIGRQLCLEVAALGPVALLVLDQSEFNLYKTECELRASLPNTKVRAILGDVRDPQRLAQVFAKYQPHLVFHAAAYKQVPMLERNVREAVLNNVLGTRNVVDAAIAARCDKFVLISSDKAVNPESVLGMTKRIAELYTDAMKDNPAGTLCLAVRFGNVLDSDGSVVPLFRSQIAQGGPVTVTHPEISRFFMTIRESCQLILQASALGEGGEIFVLDMGEPVRIAYLAEQMIRLSGRMPEQDVAIQYVGLRPGEKLHEELFYSSEIRDRTQHPKIWLARHKRISSVGMGSHVDRLVEACATHDAAEILSCLKKALGK